MNYKVKQVSKLVGVSVRTLHHYDEIGLLMPKFITDAGYRIYADEDLERLQQILFFKELDFSLQEIKNILDTPGFDKKKALYRHKKLLIEKRKRVERLITTVEKTLKAFEERKDINTMDMFEGFDMTEIEKHKEKYAEETKEKYENNSAYIESIKKTSKYTKEDWARIHAEKEKIDKKIISNMDKGVKDVIVQEEVAKLRQHITDNYYQCTVEIFRGLGDLYVQDERFTKNIDKNKSGYAVFLREAIHYYCDRFK
ncbi:MerR family transcriptional regulator [Mariniplasma anaerobium]|uniref:MerR family transcriptional regulator n=1 Tax=Mariniplasma anaerobium TaxID=2735436 RepID=A0A7U9XWD1_9MOLU|nr:MerR family transcriptional regulator [Mariniplasma anaerobium]BCR35148.1 MerR family transcriptional regulator [Mariniplasma anaerobium]